MEAKSVILAFTTILFVAAGAGSAYWWRASSANDEYLSSLEKRNIHFGDREISAWVADTVEKRTHGLMYVARLGENEGMIFVFPEEGTRSFWNKNTLLDLDLIWVRDNKVVGVSPLSREVEKGTAHVSSPGEVDTVVEVPSGWAEKYGVNTGDGVKF